MPLAVWKNLGFRQAGTVFRALRGLRKFLSELASALHTQGLFFVRELQAPQDLMKNGSGPGTFIVTRFTLLAIQAKIFFDTLYVGLTMSEWARCSIELTGGKNRLAARPNAKRQRR